MTNKCKIKIPPLERKWFKCQKCEQKLLLFDNTAISEGVYIKCKKCGTENEIKLGDAKNEPLSLCELRKE